MTMGTQIWYVAVATRCRWVPGMLEARSMGSLHLRRGNHVVGSPRAMARTEQNSRLLTERVFHEIQLTG